MAFIQRRDLSFSCPQCCVHGRTYPAAYLDAQPNSSNWQHCLPLLDAPPFFPLTQVPPSSRGIPDSLPPTCPFRTPVPTLSLSPVSLRLHPLGYSAHSPPGISVVIGCLVSHPTKPSFCTSGLAPCPNGPQSQNAKELSCGIGVGKGGGELSPSPPLTLLRAWNSSVKQRCCPLQTPTLSYYSSLLLE